MRGALSLTSIKVYYWITTRKSQERALYGSARGISEDDVPRILLNSLIDQRNPTKAEHELLNLKTLKKWYTELEEDYQREDFLGHMRRYLDIWRTDCPFEINTTNRYTKLHDEASVTARKMIRHGESIKYLSGTLVEITRDEEAELKKAKRDFSVVFSSWKKKHKMFLGPARFANHDCKPNARLDATINGEAMQVVAIQEIQPGDEITVDYGKDYFSIRNSDCLCATCESVCGGKWLRKDGGQPAGRGRAILEQKPLMVFNEDRVESQSSGRGRRRRRGKFAAEELPNKKQKLSHLPPSPPPSRSSANAESSSRGSRTSDGEDVDRGLRGAAQRSRIAHLPGDTTPSSEQAAETQQRNLRTFPSQSLQSSFGSRDFRRGFMPTPPFDEIPETPPPRSASPELMPSIPIRSRSERRRRSRARSSGAISVSSSVHAGDTEDHPLDICSDGEISSSESDESDSWETTGDEDERSDMEDIYPIAQMSELYRTTEERQIDELFDEDLMSTDIIPPADLGRTSRSTSVESASSDSSEENQLLRYPGDHYRTAAVLTMPDSRWVECRTCNRYWVQRAGRDTKRECPRCERHSRIYGFGWPKTDPKRSRVPEQPDTQESSDANSKDEKKCEKKDRNWRGWAKLPVKDEVRLMDQTFVRRYLTREEEREEKTKGRGILKPGEVEAEPSRKRRYEDAADDWIDEVSIADSEDESSPRRSRRDNGEGSSINNNYSPYRAQRASAAQAQDNWRMTCRTARDGTIKLQPLYRGFGTRKNRRGTTASISPQKPSPRKAARLTKITRSDEPFIKAEPPPRVKKSTTTVTTTVVKTTKLRRPATRTRNPQSTQAQPTSSSQASLNNREPNKAPLTRPGIAPSSLVSRRPKLVEHATPRVKRQYRMKSRGIGVNGKRVGRPVGSTNVNKRRKRTILAAGTEDDDEDYVEPIGRRGGRASV